jgi:hypothetical protein
MKRYSVSYNGTHTEVNADSPKQALNQMFNNLGLARNYNIEPATEKNCNVAIKLINGSRESITYYKIVPFSKEVETAFKFNILDQNSGTDSSIVIRVKYQNITESELIDLIYLTFWICDIKFYNSYEKTGNFEIEYIKLTKYFARKVDKFSKKYIKFMHFIKKTTALVDNTRYPHDEALVYLIYYLNSLGFISWYSIEEEDLESFNYKTEFSVMYDNSRYNKLITDYKGIIQEVL